MCVHVKEECVCGGERIAEGREEWREVNNGGERIVEGRE